MTPEERFAEHVLWVLEKIKEESLVTLEGSDIEYKYSHLIASGIPSKDTEKKILYKLLEWKAIGMPNRIAPLSPLSKWFYLKIKEPKFTEIYNKYKKISSKGAKVASSFSQSNLPFVLLILRELSSTAEFSTGNEVSYSLRMPPGTQLMLERQLLTKLQSLGILRYVGEDGIYGIATLKDVDAESIKDAISIINEKINPESNEESQISQPGKTAPQIYSSNWIKQSKWTNTKEYSLPNKKKVIFSTENSTRIKIFKLLINANGDWVTVAIMAKETGKDDKIARVTIGQMNDENLKNTGLQIVPKNDVGEPGAYKLIYQAL